MHLEVPFSNPSTNLLCLIWTFAVAQQYTKTETSHRTPFPAEKPTSAEAQRTWDAHSRDTESKALRGWWVWEGRARGREGVSENEGHKEESDAQQLYQYHLSAQSSSAQIHKHTYAPTSTGYCSQVLSTYMRCFRPQFFKSTYLEIWEQKLHIVEVILYLCVYS